MLHGPTPNINSITYVTGDATSPNAEGDKIIVHVCNDVGAWGRGFVVALSRRWPEPERRYRAWYRQEEQLPFALGEVQLVQVARDMWVANLIGQHDIKTNQTAVPIRYEAVQEGLRKIRIQAKQLNASIHMPRIGCGLAGGRWEEIAPIINEELLAHGVAVTVYDLPT